MKALSMTICAAICCLGNPAGIAGPVCLSCDTSAETYQHIQRNIELRNMRYRQQDMEQQMQQNRYRRQQGLPEF